MSKQSRGDGAMAGIRKAGYGWIAAGVFALDRVTKILAPGIPEGGCVLIPGVVGLRYAENRGIAFSLLSGRPWLLGLLSLVIIVAAFFLLRGKNLPGMTLCGLMMMLGGAAGNMVDRFFLGYVPDMIEFLFVDFAIFNAADAFLCVGCALVILRLLFGKDPEAEGDKK